MAMRKERRRGREKEREEEKKLLVGWRKSGEKRGREEEQQRGKFARGNVTIFEHCRGRPLKRLRCEEGSIRSWEEMSSYNRVGNVNGHLEYFGIDGWLYCKQEEERGYISVSSSRSLSFSDRINIREIFIIDGRIISLRSNLYLINLFIFIH